jgi:hypothetical protein
MCGGLRDARDRYWDLVASRHVPAGGAHRVVRGVIDFCRRKTVAEFICTDRCSGGFDMVKIKQIIPSFYCTFTALLLHCRASR